MSLAKELKIYPHPTYPASSCFPHLFFLDSNNNNNHPRSTHTPVYMRSGTRTTSPLTIRISTPSSTHSSPSHPISSPQFPQEGLWKIPSPLKPARSSRFLGFLPASFLALHENSPPAFRSIYVSKKRRKTRLYWVVKKNNKSGNRHSPIAFSRQDQCKSHSEQEITVEI